MIKHRVINGAVMIGLLIGALLLPEAGVFLIIPVLASLMIWEFYRLLAVAGYGNFPVLGTIGGAAMILLTGMQYLTGWLPDLEPPRIEMVSLAFLMLAVCLRQIMDTKPGNAIVKMSMTLFGVMYVSFLFNFYTKLLLRWDGDSGRYLLFYMILVVKVTDMAAYFTGCSVGKHKLIPRISPAKTWEGCAGGVAGGLLTSLIFWWSTDGQIGPIHLSVAHAVILGIVLPVTGIVGDLIESLLKRAASVKDSGTVLKGMGGVMDVLDSLLFAAPVLYLYVLIFF
jgi:phosphatidate cytidylyltransferase